jgi:uncharacterized protein (DUF885 family)
VNYLVRIILAVLLANNILFAQDLDPAKELYRIFEDEWTFRLKEYPTFAAELGIKEALGKLPSITVADEQRRAAFYRKLLQRLQQIDFDKLSASDQVNYEVFEYILKNNIAEVEYETYLTPINSEGGFYTNFMFTVRGLTLHSRDDFENLLKLLNEFPRYADEHLALLRLGVQKGRTLPRILMSDSFFNAIDAQIVDKPADSPLYLSVARRPESISEADWAKIDDALKTAIAEKIIPTFRKIKTFLKEEYIPKAAELPGISSQPNGRQLYEHLVRYYTTTDLSPEAIHQIGLNEVKRIKAEMEAIIDKLEFDGGFAEFLQFLRTDSRFYAKTAQELLMYVAYLAKKADGKLPAFFGMLPRNTYGVEPVPDDIAPTYTTGRYVGGSLKKGQAGKYWVNTYKLESRPLYVLPALTLHESVPGHHLQISLAQEQENVPEFRKHLYLSAYGEGWALYCEYLGEEMGMYATPYEVFGKLTYEMWRACRLVVDTGIHAMGWSRQQAVDFLAQNTALSFHEVNTEIDRYIGWPGQALSYKMGELKIRELRTKAERALGKQFDLRTFHDLILSQGAVPLYVLEGIVQHYINAAQSN